MFFMFWLTTELTFWFSVPRAAKLPMEMLYVYAGCRAMESSLQNRVIVNTEFLEHFQPLGCPGKM